MDHAQSEQNTASYEAYRNVADNRGQAIKLEFRFKSGDAEQFEYSYLTRTTFKYSEGEIIMKFMDAIVTIEGTNLSRLKDDLRHNKVEWVQEAVSDFEGTDPQAMFVRKIAVEER